MKKKTIFSVILLVSMASSYTMRRRCVPYVFHNQSRQQVIERVGIARAIPEITVAKYIKITDQSGKEKYLAAGIWPSTGHVITYASDTLEGLKHEGNFKGFFKAVNFSARPSDHVNRFLQSFTSQLGEESVETLTIRFHKMIRDLKRERDLRS